ncbi:17687_t:CDS:1, partial [Cetraspora pellucida]
TIAIAILYNLITTIKSELSTNKNLDLKNALLFSEFIGSDEFKYKDNDYNDVFSNETMSYMSGSYDKNN